MQSEIRRALIDVHNDDLRVIRQYVAWIRIRRKVTDLFYFNAHWVKPEPVQVAVQRFHWVGG